MIAEKCQESDAEDEDDGDDDDDDDDDDGDNSDGSDEEKVEGQELRLCDDYSKIIAQASREELLVLQVREAKRTLSEMLRGAFLTAVQMLLAANLLL